MTTCQIVIPAITPDQGVYAGKVRWWISNGPIFRTSDGGAVVFREQEASFVNGVATLNIPNSDQYTPAAEYIIAMPGPYGAWWTGQIPDDPGPLTLEQLRQFENWGLVQPTGQPVIEKIVGPAGASSSGLTHYMSNHIDLAAALTAIGSAATRLVIDVDAHPAVDTTIPANVLLTFGSGKILPSSNAVVTVASPITAPSTAQIFGAAAGLKHYWGTYSTTQAYAVGDYVLSAGKYYQTLIAHTNQPVSNATYWLPIPMVVFSGRAVTAEVYPEWWGAISSTAVSDGQATINLTALHAARDAARNIGSGRIVVNNTLVVNNSFDLSFLGTIPFALEGRGGLGAATLRYVGAAPIYAACTLQGSSSAIFRDLTIDGGVTNTNAVNAAAYGLLCSRNPVGLAAAGKHQFLGVTAVNCVVASHLNYGSEDNIYVKPQFTRSPIGAIITGYAIDESQTNGVYNILTPGYQPCTSYNAQHFTATGGTDQVETVTVTGSSGTFTLSRINYTTTSLPFNATASQVQAALAALPCVRGTTANPNVLVSGPNGGPFTVTWTNSCGHRSYQVMTANSNIAGGTATAVITTPGVGGKGAWVDSTNIFFLDGAFGSPFNPIGATRCGLMICGAEVFVNDGVVQAAPGVAEAGVIVDGAFRTVGFDSATWDGGNVSGLALNIGAYAPVDTTNTNKIMARNGSWSVRSVPGGQFLNAWGLVGSVFQGINASGPLGSSINLKGWCSNNHFFNMTVDTVGDGITVLESGPSNAANITIDRDGQTYLAGTTQALAQATPVISGGSVSAITLDYPGVGYALVPTVVITDQNGSTTNATATCTLSGSGIGTITLTSGGTGITSATVSFAGGRNPALVLSSAGVTGNLGVAGTLNATNITTSGSVAVGSLTPQASDKFQSTNTWNDDASIYRAGEFDAAKSVAGSNGLLGIDAYAIMTATTGTQTGILTGVAGHGQNNGLGAVVTLRGIRGVISATGGGTVTAAYAVYADQPTLSNGSTIGTAYAFYNPGQVTAGVTTAYGLYSLGGENHIRTGGDAIKGLTIRRNSATQSANLLEIQDEGGSIALASVGPTGAFTASSIDATKLTGTVPTASLPLKFNDGSATVSTGSTTTTTSSAPIAHGMASTPAASDFSITPAGPTNGAEGWWVTSITSTTFVITMGKQSVAASVTFNWTVRV